MFNKIILKRKFKKITVYVDAVSSLAVIVKFYYKITINTNNEYNIAIWFLDINGKYNFSIYWSENDKLGYVA